MTKKTTTKEQYSTILAKMQERPDIAQACPKKGLGDSKKFWNDLAAELNSLGPPTKDITSWRKVWLDWKSYVKKKVTYNKNSIANGTCNRLRKLNEEEKNIIALVGLDNSNEDTTNQVSLFDCTLSCMEPEEHQEDTESCTVSSPRPTNKKQKKRKEKYPTKDLVNDEVEVKEDFYQMCTEHFKTQDIQIKKLDNNVKRVNRNMQKFYEIKKKKLYEIKRHNREIEKIKIQKLDLMKEIRNRLFNDA